MHTLLKHDCEVQPKIHCRSETSNPTMKKVPTASSPSWSHQIQQKQAPFAPTLSTHAVDLIGRSVPRLTPHKSEEKKLGRLDSPTHQMMRAFENYSDNSRGPAIIHGYTMVAPYKSMHETIFRLAQDKLVSLIIIPFHENRQSMVGTGSTGAIRQLNLHLQEFSPCTVGILVDRGLPCRPSVSYFSYVVALFFIGGPDDREALAYISRLADNPDVGITVFRIIVMRTNKTEGDDDVETEFKLDESLLNEFKLRNTRNDRLDWHDIEVDAGCWCWGCECYYELTGPVRPSDGGAATFRCVVEGGRNDRPIAQSRAGSDW